MTAIPPSPALDELRRLHAAVPALFTDAPNPMALYGLDGTLIERNATATRVFGPALGTQLRDVLGLGAKEQAAVFAAVGSGRELTFDTIARTAGNDAMPISLSLWPAYAGGAIVAGYALVVDRTNADRELQASRSLFDHAADPFMEFSIDGRCVAINAAFTAMAGWTEDELVGRNFVRWRSVDEAVRAEQIIAAVVEHRAPYSFDTTIPRKGGGAVEIEARAIPRIVDGILTGLYVSARDVTETRRLRESASEHVRRIEALYRIATSTAAARDQVDAALATAAERLGFAWGFVARVGDGALTVLNSVGDAAEVARRPVGHRAPLDGSLLPRVLASQDILVVPDLRASTPEVRLARDFGSYAAIRLEVGGRFYGALGFTSRHARPAFSRDDITFVRFLATLVAVALERDARERRLGDLALRDPLTGLPNRTALYEAIDDALQVEAPSGTVAVLYVDLDRFKPVNDTFGHEAGDEVLRTVATRLRAVVRTGDLVGRLGGDEFIVLQRAATASRAHALAGRIVSAVSEPYAIHEGVAEIGASVGVAFATTDDSVDEVLRRADAALYVVKGRGGGGVSAAD